MNDLQILLISAGVVLIVVVLAYNGWQEWRARRSMQADPGEDRHDVLMQQNLASRREPTMQSGREPRPETDENAEIDVLCEAVIDINLAKPLSGEIIAQHLTGLDKICTKPIRAILTNTDGAHKTVLRPENEYIMVQLAVLLANRQGPLTEIDWSHLWSYAQYVADKLDATLEAPDQTEVVDKASKLDSLCASMDAQVGLILQLEKAVGARQIDEVAASCGFIDINGTWVLLADNKMPRFSLLMGPDNTVHRVDLVLDVPNSLPDSSAFSNMVAIGRNLAEHLNAHVLDDQGRTFQDSSAAAIDKQLNDLYDKLDNAGFVAGTARAARVFA